jgi:hypothetical protein
LSRLAVAQARVRRVIGTCYAIWKVPPGGYGRSPQSPRLPGSPSRAAFARDGVGVRLVKALARQFARTRAASAQRRHRYRSGPKASGTGCALQLRFRRLWDSNSRRGQRHKVGGKCGSPAVGCRLPNSQTTVGILGLRREDAQSLFSQRLYAFSAVAPKGNPRSERFFGGRFRAVVRCPERMFGGAARSVRHVERPQSNPTIKIPAGASYDRLQFSTAGI